MFLSLTFSLWFRAFMLLAVRDFSFHDALQRLMKTIGIRKVWCELRQILVPEGKGRFFGIRTEYRGHSETAIYLCRAKRICLQTAGEHKQIVRLHFKIHGQQYFCC